MRKCSIIALILDEGSNYSTNNLPKAKISVDMSRIADISTDDIDETQLLQNIPWIVCPRIRQPKWRTTHAMRPIDHLSLGGGNENQRLSQNRECR